MISVRVVKGLAVAVSVTAQFAGAVFYKFSAGRHGKKGMVNMHSRRIESVVSAVALTFVALSAHAVDWSSVSGSYTVPADTTNEVTTAADFDLFTNRVTKVIFANENSTLRFTVPTYPHNMPFQGYGSVVMSERVLLSGGTTLKHSNGTSEGTQFLRFVFEKGIDSDDGSTTRNLGVNPGDPGFMNAAIYLMGPLSNVTVGALTAARIDVGEGAYLNTSGTTIGYNGRTAMINLHGGTICKDSSIVGGDYKSRVAILMECGVFTNGWGGADNQRIYSRSRYLNFRQNGGYFYSAREWKREDSYNDATYNVIPSDFMFCGTAVATNTFSEYRGPLNLGVMGDAVVNAGTLKTNGDTFGKYRHIIAMNGGELLVNIPASSTNTFFAFNGGTRRRSDWSGDYMFGNHATVGNTAWVRIYENGGCLDLAGRDSTYLPELRAPVGNVLQSIAMSEELAGKVWQTPPAVEITDSTGAGSNAVAIVDYDFDSGKVTNITVVCRGENFSGIDGDVTANLRYKDGDALLTTPLVCTVGPCESGGMTFLNTSDAHSFYSGCTTNTFRGKMVIDMDHTRENDHNTEKTSGALFSVSVENGTYHPLFSTTGLVVRTGAFGRSYVEARPRFDAYFPDCTSIEFYGGYFYGFAVADTVKNIVVGGETWLTNYGLVTSSYYSPTIEVPADGTLTVDYGAVVTNGVIVTPALKYGRLTFADGAKIAVKSCDCMLGDDQFTLLDLSGTTVSGTPTVELSADVEEKLSVTWDGAAQKLYGRMRKNGFVIIIR